MLAINIGDFNHGDIESTTTQVIYRNGVIAFGFVHTISQCRRSRLINDTFYIKTSNLTGIFSGLTLRVIKVSRHGNNGFRNRLAQIILGGLFHFLQNFCRNLWRCFLVALSFHPSITIVGADNFVRHHRDVFLYDIIFELTTYQTLHCEQCIGRVGYGLTLSALTHQNFTVVGKRNNGWGSAIALGVFNNFCFFAFQHGYTRVGGSQIDTNDFAHFDNLRKFYLICYLSQPASCADHSNLLLSI